MSMNNFLSPIQEMEERIYKDAFLEMTWAETYEECFQICERGQKQINQLYNNQNTNDDNRK